MKRHKQKILERECRGSLIHADETTIDHKKEDRHTSGFSLDYAKWPISMRKVEKETFFRTLLSGFKGVLISDFYAAYDSISCQQQKCLDPSDA